MSYSLLLILALFLGLLVLHLSAFPRLEFFVDFSADSDLATWIKFQNNEFCPFWNDILDYAKKNDQADLPPEEQLGRAQYALKLQEDWNTANNTHIKLVVCETSPVATMSPSTLIKLVPEGPQNYLDSLNMIISKLKSAIDQVNAALHNEGFTSFTKEFECQTNDDGSITCTAKDDSRTCQIPSQEQKEAAMTPEEKDKNELLRTTILSRVKSINQSIDVIRKNMNTIRNQKAQLDEIKRKGEDGSLYSKDGTVPTQKHHEPTKTRLFFN